MSEEYVERKAILLGSVAVGKSSILRKWGDDEFDPNIQPSIGLGCTILFTNYKDDKMLKLTIWDTSGQEKFFSQTRKYFRETDCAIIVFDCTNENSFNDLRTWISLLEEECEGCPFLLICNKIDLSDNYSDYEQKANSILSDYDAHYFCVSAKEGDGLDVSLKKLIEIVGSERQTKIDNSKGIQPNPDPIPKKCC